MIVKSFRSWSRGCAPAATIAAASVLIGACGDNPVDPTAHVQISCPASKSAESLSGEPVVVDFGTPSTSGGTAPVSVTCNPPSGSKFPVGTTPVQCTARDAKQQTASCTLNVTVTRVGTLSATKFLAFGDSITQGVLAQCPTLSRGTTALTPQEFFLRDLAMLRAAVNVPTSYPTVLGTQLQSRYPAQSPVVTNVGLAGERVTDDSWGTNDVTLARLRSEMSAFSPQILLLLEGVNDLNSNVLHPEVTIPAVVKGLKDLAREARQRGASQVFIGTLLPQQAGACRAFSANQVAPANEQIRAMVAAESHVLVDVFNGFGGVAGSYIGVDGLHPNEVGYQKMAQIFLDSIKVRLER